MIYKYPRTPHLPWSEGVTSDDKILKILNFDKIVCTEKLDGENCGMTRDICHARSLDSGYHSSRTLVKKIHGEIAYKIPKDWHIFGENMFAEHSISYCLTDVFYVFLIVDENENCLSFNKMKEFCDDTGLSVVPLIYNGIFDEKLLKTFNQGESAFGSIREGYVIRNKDEFKLKDFGKNVAKFVRKNHVQTDEHWMKSWKPNKVIQ